MGAVVMGSGAACGEGKDAPVVGDAGGFTGGKKGEGSGAVIGATGGGPTGPAIRIGVAVTGAGNGKGNGAFIDVGGTKSGEKEE